MRTDWPAQFLAKRAAGGLLELASSLAVLERKNYRDLSTTLDPRSRGFRNPGGRQLRALQSPGTSQGSQDLAEWEDFEEDGGRGSGSFDDPMSQLGQEGPPDWEGEIGVRPGLGNDGIPFDQSSRAGANAESGAESAGNRALYSTAEGSSASSSFASSYSDASERSGEEEGVGEGSEDSGGDDHLDGGRAESGVQGPGLGGTSNANLPRGTMRGIRGVQWGLNPLLTEASLTPSMLEEGQLAGPEKSRNSITAKQLAANLKASEAAREAKKARERSGSEGKTGGSSFWDKFKNPLGAEEET